MTEIRARNVNDALASALVGIATEHDVRNSRNGPVIAFKEPVTTIYAYPTERVLFSPKRNANPVFHLMESLWMLAGRNDTAFLTPFVKRIGDYSDDGMTLWGAYGFRWREFFGYDQLDAITAAIRQDPNTRRAVLAMWNGMQREDENESDLAVAANGGKDVPCNTHVYFDARDGRLNMTVCCRSNDLWWGCYGANAVHFSVLLEYMAAKCGLPVGVYRQMSNDLHVYTSVVSVGDLGDLARDAMDSNLYNCGMKPQPLIDQHETVEMFDQDVTNFFGLLDMVSISDFVAGHPEFKTEFFNFTVVPMLRAWRARKNFDGAPRLAERIASVDWAVATKDWLLRNQK